MHTPWMERLIDDTRCHNNTDRVYTYTMEHLVDDPRFHIVHVSL
jgi:hypothetical protein